MTDTTTRTALADETVALVRRWLREAAAIPVGGSAAQLAGLLRERLLARDDVDYVSIKVSATVPPHSPWAFDEAVAAIVERLTPLFTLAATAGTAKFVNLDMEEYKDLDLTAAVFTRLLDRPEFRTLEAGIVLQAYLPDALAAMIRLQEWAARRRDRGGAGVKVRLVKGANLPMEQVEASLHGWPPATWGSKPETDTNYKRVLDYAMRPERIGNVRLGVAGHNLFDVAHAWLLAGRRGVRDGVVSVPRSRRWTTPCPRRTGSPSDTRPSPRPAPAVSRTPPTPTRPWPPTAR